MIKVGLPIEQIETVTDLTKEEIEKLMQKLNYKIKDIKR